jgi:hypothetical protein
VGGRRHLPGAARVPPHGGREKILLYIDRTVMKGLLHAGRVVHFIFEHFNKEYFNFIEIVRFNKIKFKASGWQLFEQVLIQWQV